jgi:hypothetical protein
MLVVVQSRERIKNGPPPPIEYNRDGTLTREGALVKARELWGELGTISSTDDYPKLVWCIGRLGMTVGRGKTWEIALQRSAARKKKLDLKKFLQELKKETTDVSASS